MLKLNPHINCIGNTQEPFDLYKSLFSWKFSKLIDMDELATEEFPISDS